MPLLAGYAPATLSWPLYKSFAAPARLPPTSPTAILLHRDRKVAARVHGPTPMLEQSVDCAALGLISAAASWHRKKWTQDIEHFCSQDGGAEFEAADVFVGGRVAGDVA